MGKLAYRTLRENIVEEIREKILNQELTPGMRIVEQDISDEFGVSRGPIREALRQLEQELNECALRHGGTLPVRTERMRSSISTP